MTRPAPDGTGPDGTALVVTALEESAVDVSDPDVTALEVAALGVTALEVAALDASDSAVSTAGRSTDRVRVAELLGREPQGAFEVVARNAAGDPAVIRNEPFLDDGTPMPTRYWLVDPDLLRRIGTLESAGGVRRAEAEVDPDALAACHARYAAERDAAIPEGHTGPRPSGGVGGTRTGVKCLHTHYAHFLAGGDDPIGRWVDSQLSEAGREAGPRAETLRAESSSAEGSSAEASSAEGSSAEPNQEVPT